MFVPQALRISRNSSPSPDATRHWVAKSGSISSAKPDSVHMATPSGDPSVWIAVTVRR